MYGRSDADSNSHFFSDLANDFLYLSASSVTLLSVASSTRTSIPKLKQFSKEVFGDGEEFNLFTIKFMLDHGLGFG